MEARSLIAAMCIFISGFSFGILSVAVAFRMGSRWAQTTIENNIRARGITLIYGSVAEETDEGEGGLVQ